MSLSDQIAAKTAMLVASKDALVAAQKEYADKPDDDSAFAALETAIGNVEAAEKSLTVLKRAEDALKGSFSEARAPAIIKSHKTKEGSADLLFKSALVTFEAGVTHQSVDAIIAKRFGEDDGLRAVVGMTNKAAQDPADTATAGYAKELTRQSYAEFMNLLQPVSVIPRLQLDSHSFDGYSSIYIPQRSGSASSNPNMAAAFRAEGAPIRVGGLSLTSKTLTPKTLGVIGTFTEELLRRSTPSILNVIRNAMLEDTAVALDGVFLGTGAGSATTPAGIANSLSGNTAGASGVTPADAYEDLIAMVKKQADALLGMNPAWVMSPANAIALGGMLTSLGTVQFQGMQSLRGSKTLFGIPVIESTNIANTRVLLIDQPAISFAGGAPEFLVTQVATLHEEGSAPADISAVGTPNVVAAPVRSLYQTYSQALRTVWELDWAVMRTGAVIELTSVAW